MTSIKSPVISINTTFFNAIRQEFLFFSLIFHQKEEKRARKARERKPEKRESGKKKNLSTVFENILKIVQH